MGPIRTRVVATAALAVLMSLVLAGESAAVSSPAAAAPLSSPMSSPAAAPSGSMPAGPVSPSAAEDTAVGQAKLLGSAVEVPVWTSETRRVLANPDATLTLEQSVVPVRVRRGSGWVAVDTTLRRDATGVVAGATTAGVVFSGGGTAPMATVSRAGTSLAVSWPYGALPAPALSGSTATYAEVLPGVDLVLTATADGYTEVLVVKSPAAAADTRVRTLRFGTQVAGGTVRASQSGFAVVDRSGVEVLTSPRPLMWDTDGAAAAGSAAAATPGGAGDSTSGPAGPDEGDRVANMTATVTGPSVDVVADAAMLASPAAVFPLYLDPGVSATANRTAWAMVNRSYPNTAYYKWTGDEGAGWTDQEGTHLKRLFFQFDVAAVRGKHILSSTFKAFETWSHSCTAAQVLLGTAGSFGSGTTWNNQPSWIRQIDSRTVAYGRTGCTPGGSWVDFNAVSGVSEAASKNWSALVLQMRGYPENDRVAWKRFRYDTTLSVTYNTPPAKPVNLRTTSPATTCVVSDTPPLIPNDPPTLVARINDADASKGQTVYARFALYENDGPWLKDWDVGWKLPNVDFSIDVPASLMVDKKRYSWHVTTNDGVEWGPTSDWCDFEVDASKPMPPTITAPTGQTYTYGQSATFTFGPGGSTDVARYGWAVGPDAPMNFVAAGANGTATTQVPMTAFGPTALRVWSYDRAGNVSASYAQLDLAVAGSHQAGRWALNETSGTTAAGSAAPPHPLTLTSGATWSADHALSLNGTSGSAATTGWAGVPTTANFSMSAWLRPTDTATRRVAVSQDGPGGSTFTIGVSATSTDVAVRGANGTVTTVSSLVPPVPGDWVHVVGVFEYATGRLTLYLDGDYAADTVIPLGVANARPAASTGPLRLGRDTASTGFWLGDVDEVSVHDGALPPEQVQNLYSTGRP
jgi:hypothetical protein